MDPSVAHFQGITALVAHVRKHPAYFTQHGFLASWGFIQQVKMLGYGVKHTSSLRGSYILAQGSFALRWPTSWLATVQQVGTSHYEEEGSVG